jgi:Domain of Unknown Function (DUF1080)
MKHRAVGFVCALAGISATLGADLPPVNDGNHHGDPPFLLEAGWKPLLNGKNLDGWTYRSPQRAGWTTTSGVYWSANQNPRDLVAMPSPGDRIINTAPRDSVTNVASDLVTTEKFGDIELYIEFLIPSNSNSGVYIQGLYEVQIWDSFAKDLSNHISNLCGAIYHYDRLIDGQRTGAVAPRVRAELPAGQWQSFHVWFQAPRFNATGKKVANAKFLRVLHNGVLIHENVERAEKTQVGMDYHEAPENPLMLQGDHGTVAFRNIYVRPLRPLPGS